MTKSVDINILKHDILLVVLQLQDKKEPFTPEMVAEKVKTKATKAQTLTAFMTLKESGLIEIQEYPLLKERFFVKGITMEGLMAIAHNHFPNEYHKSKRAKWNETGQILSPYISITALIITAILFAVDKCSGPSSYELTIGNQTYNVREK